MKDGMILSDSISDNFPKKQIVFFDLLNIKFGGEGFELLIKVFFPTLVCWNLLDNDRLRRYGNVSQLVVH